MDDDLRPIGPVVARGGAWDGVAQPRMAIDTSSLDLALKLLRRDHPQRYFRWVLIGTLAGLIGYGATTVALVLQQAQGDLFMRSDPYVAAVHAVAQPVAVALASAVIARLAFVPYDS